MKKILACAVALLASSSVLAADLSADQIKQKFESVDAGIHVSSVDDAAVKGFYEVVFDSGEIVYASGDGEHFFAGPLLAFTDNGRMVNLTEQKMSSVRSKAIAQVPASERIIYPAKGEMKARLQVFTDVDCPYCHKLHQEVPKLNEMGIQVEYLAFPRMGMNSDTARKMSAIWCAPAKQRNELFDEAIRGKALKPVDCDNPMEKEMNLGRQLGVNGTPALVLEDGTMVPGYMPAERIQKMLNL